MTDTGTCIDCLTDYSLHPSTCSLVVEPVLSLASGSMKHADASSTVTVQFTDDGRFVSRLPTTTVRDRLRVSVRLETGCDSKYTVEYATRISKIVVDVYFESSCEEDATVELETVGGVVLVKEKSKKAELIFVSGMSKVRVAVTK